MRGTTNHGYLAFNMSIGNHVVIGTNFVVAHDVPDYSVEVGSLLGLLENNERLKRGEDL